MTNHHTPHQITIPRRTTPPPTPKPKPTYTRRKPTTFAAGAGGRINIHDWLRFASAMRLAIESGLPLLHALSLLEQTDPRRRVRTAAATIRQSLNRGQSLDQSLAASPDIPPLVRILTDTGNRFGRLDQTFAIIESHYQWLLSIRRALLSALLYPFMIIILGLLIKVGTAITIATLQGTPVAPAFTAAALTWWLPPLLAAAAGWLLATLIRHPKIRPATDRVALTIPLIGHATRTYSLAVFFRILAAGIKSGIPITLGWNTATASCPNLHIGQRLNQQLYRLQDGESLADTLRHSRVASPDALGMFATGEAVAEVPQLIENLARQYTNEAHNLIIRRMKTLLPFLIIAIGIGFFLYPPLLAIILFVIGFLRRLV